MHIPADCNLWYHPMRAQGQTHGCVRKTLRRAAQETRRAEYAGPLPYLEYAKEKKIYTHNRTGMIGIYNRIQKDTTTKEIKDMTIKAGAISIMKVHVTMELHYKVRKDDGGKEEWVSGENRESEGKRGRK